MLVLGPLELLPPPPLHQAPAQGPWETLVEKGNEAGDLKHQIN